MPAPPGSPAPCADHPAGKNKARSHMNAEQLKQALEASLPSPVFEEGGEWTTVTVDPAAWSGIARQLRSTPGLDFDYLFCVTAIDWKTHFTMVYHFSSTRHRHTLVVKIKLDR